MRRNDRNNHSIMGLCTGYVWVVLQGLRQIQQAIQAEQEAYREAVKYTEGTAKKLPCSSCAPVPLRLTTWQSQSCCLPMKLPKPLQKLLNLRYFFFLHWP